VGSSEDRELARYDVVLFFESAAVGDISIEGGNPTRIESNTSARELDTSLRASWSKHPRFVLVPHQPSFVKKVMLGLALLERAVAEFS